MIVRVFDHTGALVEEYDDGTTDPTQEPTQPVTPTELAELREQLLAALRRIDELEEVATAP